MHHCSILEVYGVCVCAVIVRTFREIIMYLLAYSMELLALHSVSAYLKCMVRELMCITTWLCLAIASDVELGTSKGVVIAWWGYSTPPMCHILADQGINTIVCHPQEEDTMLSEERPPDG